MVRVEAYQHGIYPRSEEVVAATRGLERGRTSSEEVEARFLEDREDFVAVQREAGLDYLSDGLLRWQDLFRPLVEASGGLVARTLVRWFDNNTFFRAPQPVGELTSPPSLPPVFDWGGDLPGPRVATLPSPYLFSRAAQFDGDRNALMMDLTREVLRPVAAGLAARGYALLHLQEPWLVYHGIEPEDWHDLAKALLELRDGVAGTGCQIVLHTYFADAGPHLDRLRRLPVDAVGVDFVETDLEEVGRAWEVGILAGVLDARRSWVEPAASTAEFVLEVAGRTEAPWLLLSSNAELEYLPRDLAREKVRRLGEVAALVREGSR